MAPARSSTAPLKYVVGIDIAKDTFVACFGRIDTRQYLSFGKETTFANTPAGFAALLVWTAKQQVAAAPQWFVVEATGVYYEELAYFLADNAHLLSVLLPNKVKHFAQSTEQKSKTDQLDARLLCRLGLERALPAWQPPTPALRQLRALSRERQSLTQQVARLKTQRHAYQHSYQPDARTLERLAARIQLLDQQLKAVDQDLAALLEAEPELARKLAHLTSVPGIGLTTAIVVVAETNGFVLMENERQLASYAGLDCGAAAKWPLGGGHAHLPPWQCTLAYRPLPTSSKQPPLQPAANGFLRPTTGAPAQRQARRHCRHA